MVNAHRAVGRTIFKTGLPSWIHNPLAALRRDMQGWWASVRGRSPIRPGLSTYYFNLSGGKRRIHLRVGTNGSGILMVDATDAVHLNQSAAIMAKFALDGRPKDHALAALGARFSAVGAGEARRHVDQIYDLVDHLKTTTDACPTCGLDALRTPFFSVQVAAPYKADLALTYGCNNACRHCYNRVQQPPLSTNLRSVPGEGQGEGLSLPQWKKTLQKLAHIGVPHVIFTGGEPTLYPGLVDLIREAENIGLITGLNTNGRRLAVRSYVNALLYAGLSHVQITLESCRAEIHNTMTCAYSFVETCLGIANAISAGLHVITNTTLTRRNVGHALETIDFLHRLGLKTFAMNGMIYSGRGLHGHDAVEIEQLHCVLAAVRDRAKTLGMSFLWYTPTDYCRLSPLELDLGPRRCNAGEYSMCIEPNGDVLPCQSYYVAAGNILRDPWPQIWHSDLFHGFRDRVRDPRACGLPERCWQCPDLHLCAGGCRLEQLHSEKIEKEGLGNLLPSRS
jgi:radical SAM protein with 4Fe4S-binding SPASM domain